MCLVWGVPYLFIKVAVRELSPAALVLARTGIAALILVPLAARSNELRPLVRRWKPLLLFSAIEIAIPWLLLGHAEQRITSSLAGLLLAGVPLVTVVIAATTGDRERPGRTRSAGLLLGLAGVAAIVGVSLDGAGALPIAEVGAVAVCYAVGPFVLQRALADLPALGVIAASLGIAAVAYVPIGVFALPEELPSAEVIGSVFALAVVCTAVAFLVFFALVAEIGPSRAMVFTYVNPAVAAVLGVAVLGEELTLGIVGGFVLVLVGSVLATRPPPSPTPALEPVAGSR
jgi:drug/metabolite transporter (DMT)-like permease